jgi:NADPH:quinone reductase-like Zn-dependent oxidoreductase
LRKRFPDFPKTDASAARIDGFARRGVGRLILFAADVLRFVPGWLPFRSTMLSSSGGSTMTNKAWALRGVFGADRLELEERPAREPGFGEARVRIEWVSLNRRDLLLIEGVYNPRQILPIVPCSDGAGTIEALGAGCERLQIGDRVVAHFFPGWIAGEPDMAKLATALGGPGGDGTLQQTLVIAEQALVRLPEAISTQAAATLPCAALTAWCAVVEQGGARPGSLVLTQGTGGVSLFAVQFAKMLGARVIATTSSEAKATTLRELGADAILNYRAEPDWGRRAREIAGGPIDLIVEVGGAETLEASLRLIRPGGTIALSGVLSGAKAAINLPLAVMRQVRLQGVTCGHRENFEAMLRAIAAHGIDPVVWHRFTLSEAREAFACMAGNAHVGKILVEMAG